MQEDKKESKQEEIKPAEAKPADTKPAEAAPQAKDAAAPQAQAPEKKEAEKPKKEKPANCAACNKSIKKKLFYYRNGKYYCNKRCWKTILKKEEKPQETPKA